MQTVEGRDEYVRELETGEGWSGCVRGQGDGVDVLTRLRLSVEAEAFVRLPDLFRLLDQLLDVRSAFFVSDCRPRRDREIVVAVNEVLEPDALLAALGPGLLVG